MPFRFKLLKGNHTIEVPGETPGVVNTKSYRQGETFESEIELDKKFGSDKFKRLKNKLAANDPEEDDDDESDVEAQVQDDGLDKMTDAELAQFAKEAGVEIKGKKRETIIKLVRESLVNA